MTRGGMPSTRTGLAGIFHRVKARARRHADPADQGHRLFLGGRDLQPASPAGALALVERAEDRDRHQHPGAGVAEAGPGLDRRPVGLSGHADHAAGGLRDHVANARPFSYGLPAPNPWTEQWMMPGLSAFTTS